MQAYMALPSARSVTGTSLTLLLSCIHHQCCHRKSWRGLKSIKLGQKAGRHRSTHVESMEYERARVCLLVGGCCRAMCEVASLYILLKSSGNMANGMVRLKKTTASKLPRPIKKGWCVFVLWCFLALHKKHHTSKTPRL